jgi:alkylhydroperoxidase family enzyme
VDHAPARITPVSTPYEPEVDRLLAAMMGTRRMEPIALFRTMARNLPMAQAAWHLGAYGLGPTLTLAPREREILIDRTCARLGCEYEWGVHVAYFAPRAGLTAPQVASLAYGSAADGCWDSARDRLVIEVVDALTATGDVDDDLWAALADAFDETEILDLLVLTGWYHAICFVARATRLAPEPGATPLPVTASTGRRRRPAPGR